MFELTITYGPGRGSSVQLDEQGSCTIGSGEEATLRVGGSAPELAVEVKPLKGGGFGAKTLAGPFVLDGQPTTAARLEPGAVLTVGNCEIRYGPSQLAGVPRMIGGFEVLGVLGRGGMGIVYRARQLSLDREVALKLLSRERTSDPEFVGRFQAEARHAARLHHPNVVQVFDVDRDGDLYFYSMELMDGGSVEQRLKRDGKVPVEEAVRIVADAARGLAFAEQMRVIHRDIKPDNLMVDRHGHVKLADLGLAHAGDADVTRVVGTPHFMSPEQIQRKPMDHRSDLYSLGCTFFRLVTGQTPFQGATVKEIVRGHVTEPAPRADAIDPQIPAAVATIVERLLQKDPDDRYQSATELLEDLDDLSRPELRRGPWIALAIVAVLAAAGALYWALTRPSSNGGETVVEYVNDPDAERTREENRQLEADRARLAVLARHVEGEELASELERIAREHAGTRAADEAATQARGIRADLQRRAEERARRRAAIEGAVSALREAYRKAIDDGDLPAALGVLDGEPEDATVRDASELRDARGELRADLGTRAAARIEELKGAVDQALQVQDPDDGQARLAALAALVEEGTAWPSALLGDEQALRGFVGDRRTRLAALRKELASSAEAFAWRRVRDALIDEAGPLRSAVGFRPGAGGAALRELATRESDYSAGTALQPLAEAFEAAEQWLARFRAALGDGLVTVALPDEEEPATAVALQLGGDGAGLQLRAGTRLRPRDVTIDLAALRADPDRYLPPLPGVADTAAAEQRAALLTVLGWSEHMLAAADYLRSLDAADDDSGTGDGAFAVADEPLRLAGESLAALVAASTGGSDGGAAPAGWPAALRTEVAAMRQVARTLRALSARRNLTAAGLTEQLLNRFGTTITVRVLR
ncbi:MAG: serine/threonine protein kinase [Planctomycetes bacterium]|nr:serine/threonine protein kinase [Planctomycetota bacterium]